MSFGRVGRCRFRGFIMVGIRECKVLGENTSHGREDFHSNRNGPTLQSRQIPEIPLLLKGNDTRCDWNDRLEVNGKRGRQMIGFCPMFLQRKPLNRISGNDKNYQQKDRRYKEPAYNCGYDRYGKTDNYHRDN